jgi:hypothetical protein
MDVEKNMNIGTWNVRNLRKYVINQTTIQTANFI